MEPRILPRYDDEIRFPDTFGMTEAGIDKDGNVYTKLKVTSKLRNGGEYCHGAAIYALCDTACGIWCNNLWKYGATLDASMQYLDKAKVGSTLTATVHSRRVGKTVSVLFVEVFDENGLHIVDSTFTMIAVPRPGEKPEKSQSK